MKTIFTVLASSIFIISCSNKHATFNQKLVDIHDVVKSEMENYTNLVAEEGFAESDSAIAVTNKAIATINAKLTEAKALKVPKTGDTMLNNATNLYNNYLAQLNHYLVFCNKTAPDADKVVAASAIDSLSALEEQLFNKLAQSQSNYAAANGFKVKQ